MNVKMIMLFAAILLMVTSCKKDEQEGASEQNFRTDFSKGKDGWIAAFAEYSGNNEATYELKEELAALPEPLDTNQQAYMLSGMNRSDDLFMYMKKQVVGLKPSTTYTVHFTIQVASDAISGGVGAGGAPGESVGIGIGATAVEPVANANENNFYEMNIDKINQCCTDGRDMKVIGNVANGGDEYEYKMLERMGEFVGTTDGDGQLWLIVGTDSGYEGRTSLYYANIDVKLQENAP